MKLSIVALLASLLFGCASAVGPTPEPPPSDPEAPAPTAEPAPATPAAPTRAPALGEPSETRGSPRYVSAGLYITDTMTGLRWYATDMAGWYDGFDPVKECADIGRPATSAEVEALGGPLPPEFHAVFAWASHENLPFFPDNARPVVTADGCVDVKTATAYAGDCVIPTIPKVSRSTMCISD